MSRAAPGTGAAGHGWADDALAAVAGLLAFCLYWRTLAPGVLGGDSGEFQFTAWLGGFAHPTGYPLYLMLGYLWAHLLPLGDPAWRMNLFSAVWAALAVALLYRLAARAFRLAAPGAGPLTVRLLSMLAALTFAVTPAFWSQAVVAEVYALHLCFVVAFWLGLVTWAAQLRAGDPAANRTLLITAAVYGLSLAHHRTMLLLAPAALFFIWWVRRASPRGDVSLRRLRPALPLLLLPLLLYLYIPLRAPYAPYAQVVIRPGQVLSLYQNSVAGFLRYVTGQEFGSEIHTAAGALAQVGPAARWLWQEFSAAGVALGLAGLCWLGLRERRLFLLTGLSFVSLVGFNLFYGIGDIYVYYIPVYLIWTLWVAFGVFALGESIAAAARRLAGRGPAAPERVTAWLPALAAFALPVYLLVHGYAGADQSRNTQMSAGWRSLLQNEPIPPRAVLVSNDRDEMTPLWYYQYVEGLRPDVTGLFPLLGPPSEWGDVGQVTDIALGSGRPVVLVKPMPGLEVKYRLEPLGQRVRVLGPAVTSPPPRPATITYGGVMRLIGYAVAPAAAAPMSTLTITLYWQPRQPLAADYTTFVHILDADGTKVAQDDHLPGGVYYPTRLWRSGETLRDAHTLQLPAGLGRPPYTIVAGLYRLTPGLEHLGQPQSIGALAVR